jgi:hypothetical protein
MENNTDEILTLPKKGGRVKDDNSKSYNPEYNRVKAKEYYHKKKELEEPKEKKIPKGPYVRKNPILTPEEKSQKKKEYKAKYYQEIYKEKLRVKPEDRKKVGPPKKYTEETNPWTDKSKVRQYKSNYYNNYVKKGIKKLSKPVEEVINNQGSQ